MGVVPVESSVAGSFHEVYHRLAESDLSIAAELIVRMRRAVIAHPDMTLERIRTVASHPFALEQCGRFFAAHPDWQPIAHYDPAGAVQALMAGQHPADAVVATRFAAEEHHASVLAEGLEDERASFTRCIVLTREPPPARSGWTKTSLIFTLANQPGTLLEALTAFARRGVNMSKIESRPILGRPWEDRFYADILTPDATVLREALEDLVPRVRSMRVLGTYPPARTPL